MSINTFRKQNFYFNALFHTSPIKEAEMSETFSNTFYYLLNKRNVSHFNKKCNSFHFIQTLENLNRPELWMPFVFLKRNSFKKAQKQVVTKKLFMNVHFCSLGMKSYRFQLVKSQKLPCTITQFKISFKRNGPRILLIEVTY